MPDSVAGDDNAKFEADKEISEAFALFRDAKRETVIRLLAEIETGFTEDQIRSRLPHWQDTTIHRTFADLSRREITSRQEDRIRLAPLGRRRLEVMDVVREAVDNLPLR